MCYSTRRVCASGCFDVDYGRVLRLNLLTRLNITALLIRSVSLIAIPALPLTTITAIHMLSTLQSHYTMTTVRTKPHPNTKTIMADKQIPTQEYTPPSTPTDPHSTPTATSSSAHQLLHDLQTIHSTLNTLPSLAPGPETNTLFTGVVDLCTRPYSETFVSTFLSLPGVEELSLSLRILCSEAEGELERHWAGRILDSLSRISDSRCNLLRQYCT